MKFEDLQKTWQAQPSGARITIEAGALLKEVRRHQRQFARTIFCRDVREVVVCVVMTGVFGAWGVLWHWWSLYLLAACNLFVAGYFVVDRRWQGRKQPAKDDTLRACTEGSLRQVEHQIWLLKNIFWWYLLPILIGLLAVVIQLVWSMHLAGQGIAAMMGTVVFDLAVYAPVYGCVYWLNQRAVRKELEPRRQELKNLMADLQ